MGISKYTLYKYVKVDGTWQYCKAAFHENGKITPDVVFVGAMYGTGLLSRSPAVVAALPLVLQSSVRYANTLIAYLLAVVAMSAFLELSRGGIRLLIKILILAEVVVAVVGIG